MDIADQVGGVPEVSLLAVSVVVTSSPSSSSPTTARYTSAEADLPIGDVITLEDTCILLNEIDMWMEMEGVPIVL